jgi:hypothetical protein
MYLTLEPHVREHENSKEVECECFNEIMDAKYEKVDSQKVAQQQLHLTEKQCKELAETLLRHEPIFYGTLGHYLHKQNHLELLDRAELVHQKAYPVAHAHQDALWIGCGDIH